MTACPICGATDHELVMSLGLKWLACPDVKPGEVWNFPNVAPATDRNTEGDPVTPT